MCIRDRVWLIGDGLENVLGHILWVRGGEAYTHVRYSLGYHVEEFGEEMCIRDSP